VVAQLPSSESCRTSVVGEDCYKKVVWAMQTGVAKHPEYFSPLTNTSSFEDFQRHLHRKAGFSNVCSEPCAARAPEESVAAQLSSSEVCRTSVIGDECYKKVAWAMQTGVLKYPEWFSPLTSNSSFEDFQRHFHGIARFANVCAEPCVEKVPEFLAATQSPVSEGCHTSVEGEPCNEAVTWSMQMDFVDNPLAYTRWNLTESSSFEDFQRRLHSIDSELCPNPCVARE